MHPYKFEKVNERNKNSIWKIYIQHPRRSLTPSPPDSNYFKFYPTMSVSSNFLIFKTVSKAKHGVCFIVWLYTKIHYNMSFITSNINNFSLKYNLTFLLKHKQKVKYCRKAFRTSLHFFNVYFIFFFFFYLF